jgi:hypothetical protein
MLSPLPPNTLELLPQRLTGAYFPAMTMARYGVPGDGTCFFYTICAALNIDGYMHKTKDQQVAIGRSFRCSFTKSLTMDKWAAFEARHGFKTGIKTLAALKKKFCAYAIWADEPVIRYVMETFKLNLLFFDEQMRKLYCGVRGSEDQASMMVMWIQRSHFEPIARINRLDTKADSVDIQVVFNKRNDASVIDAIMASYEAQCAQ